MELNGLSLSLSNVMNDMGEFFIEYFITTEGLEILTTEDGDLLITE